MISKEKLLNSYIENDKGELRDMYIDAATRFDFPLFGDCVDYSILECCRGESNGESVYGLTSKAHLEPTSKQLTLADFKPKTKVEYVTAKYDSAWEAVKDFEDGVELFSGSLGGFNRVYDIQHVVKYYNSFCHKVETELTWEDELTRDYVVAIDDNKLAFSGVMDKQVFIEMCHLVSSANK